MPRRENKKRYFVKRENREDVAEVLPHTEPSSVELPQNTGLIPARLYQVFMSGVYTCVLFVAFSLVAFTLLKDITIDAKPTRVLIFSPASAKLHLDSLEWLVKNYRLIDAQREIAYLEKSRTKGLYRDMDVSRLESLKNASVENQAYFQALLSEYAYWHSNNKVYANYRDGLYRQAQLAFMLNNSTESKNLLQKSVDLDPQFQQGHDVLGKLQ